MFLSKSIKSVNKNLENKFPKARFFFSWNRFFFFHFLSFFVSTGFMSKSQTLRFAQFYKLPKSQKSWIFFVKYNFYFPFFFLSKLVIQSFINFSLKSYLICKCSKANKALIQFAGHFWYEAKQSAADEQPMEPLGKNQYSGSNHLKHLLLSLLGLAFSQFATRWSSWVCCCFAWF